MQDWLFAMGVAEGEGGGCACSAAAQSNGRPISRQQSFARNGAQGQQSHVGEAVTVSAPAAALTGWLASLRLGEYEERLVAQGFDTLEAMGTATEADLEAMGFKKGHLRLLLARVPSATASNESITRSSMGQDSTSSLVVATSPSRGVGINNGGDDLKPSALAPGKEEKEEIDAGVAGSRYSDPRALRPCRASSIEASNSSSSIAGEGSGNDGFKELRPEEVEMDSVIGEGSFGVVKRGRWRGMDVAVKELKTCIASAAAAAAAASSSTAALAPVMGGESAATDADGAAQSERGNKQRSDSIDGEEEMRHEARMLAKVCNHVW